MTVVRSEPDPTGVIDPSERCPKNAGPEHDHINLTWQGAKRCKAYSRARGRRCTKPVHPGAVVCITHGGKAPQVQRKAALRLAELVDPAIATLAREMTNQNNTGAERIRAAENVLDRGGYPRRAEVDDGVARALLAQRLIAMRDNAIEGEVISDTIEGEATDA